MWGLIVALVMIAATGFYSSSSTQRLVAVQSNVVKETASAMAIYRQAVIDYFTQNDVRGTSVSLEALKNSHVLPSWSTLYQQSETSIWGNYRDEDGTIYIYCTILPASNLLGEITRLSNNSVLVGSYRAADATMQSGIFGDTGIPLIALAGRAIPDGAPLWIAMTK